MRWRRVIVGVLSGLFGLWALALAIGACSYRSLLYPAPAAPATAPSDAELRTFVAKDGVAVHAFHVRAKQPKPTVIVEFHGNGQLASDLVPLAATLRDAGFDVVLAEYRGYGPSADAGKPTEQGLYADAEAILDGLAREGVGRERVVLVGQSLGTGVATEMAVRGRGRALVLLSPFTSIPQVAAELVPILLPVVIIRDRYDNFAKAPRVAVPTLIVHGDRDEIVPWAMGKLLSRTIPGARLLTIEGAHHNDLFLHPQVVDGILDHARGMKP